MASSRLHFVEIAANLTDDMFSGAYNRRPAVHPSDLSSVLQRACDAGVVRTVVTAGTLSQAREALKLVRTRPELYCTVGVHPTRAREMSGEGVDGVEYLQGLKSVIEEGKEKVVAVGELGLDYDRLGFCSVEEQKSALTMQLQGLEHVKLPLFLHDRNTGGDFARMMKENRHRFKSGVVHSFTGTKEELQAYIDLDLYIGINGYVLAIAFVRSIDMHPLSCTVADVIASEIPTNNRCSLKTQANISVAKAVPLDRLMLETDAPYCGIRKTHAGYSSIESHWKAVDKKKHSSDFCVRGRSEPCHIRQVCEVLAAARGCPQADVARAAFNNSFRLFWPDECEGPSPYDISVDAVLV
jgi:TatD DNase family protein